MRNNPVMAQLFFKDEVEISLEQLFAEVEMQENMPELEVENIICS